MTDIDLVATWRDLIFGDGKSWVVFSHGTCVVLPDPGDAVDLAGEATDLLREHGPVQVGSPAGDFNILELEDGRGWLVCGHRNDVLTYVDFSELGEADDLIVGLYGRQKRDQDGHDLQVVHVEDKRSR